MEENNLEKKGFSIASMVLGIVSIIACCVMYISVPCAILAIIFGVIGKKRSAKEMATTGFILGIISLSIDLLMVLSILGFFVAGIGTALYWI